MLQRLGVPHLLLWGLTLAGVLLVDGLACTAGCRCCRCWLLPKPGALLPFACKCVSA